MRVMVVYVAPANADATAEPEEIVPSTNRWRTPEFIEHLAERCIEFTPSEDVPLNNYYVDDLRAIVEEHQPDVIMLKTHGSESRDVWLSNEHGVWNGFTPRQAANGIHEALRSNTSVRALIFHTCYSGELCSELATKYVKIGHANDVSDDVANAYFRKLFILLAEDLHKGEDERWPRAHQMAKNHARGATNVDHERSSADRFIIAMPPSDLRSPQTTRALSRDTLKTAKPDPKSIVELATPRIDLQCRNRRWALYALLVLVVLVPLAVDLRWMPAMKGNEKLFGASQVLDFIQALVVGTVFFLIAFFDKQRPLNGHQENAQLRRDIDRVHALWTILWIAWVFLYLSFSLKHLLTDPVTSEAGQLSSIERWLRYAGNAVQNIINNVQSVTLFLLFFEMARPTFKDVHTRSPVVPMYALCVLFGIGELVFPLLSDDFWERLDSAGTVFGLVSGVFAATCFGLFVARIETKFLDMSLPVVMFLCLYAAIQPLFPIFGLEEMLAKKGIGVFDHLGFVTYCLKSFAMIGKYVMYIALFRQMANGRMAYYMHKIRYYQQKIGSEWSTFERTHFRSGGEHADESRAPTL